MTVEPMDQRLEAVYERAAALAHEHQRRARVTTIASVVAVAALLAGLSVGLTKHDGAVASSSGPDGPARVELPPHDQRPPVANRDHWHVAYGIWICGEFVPSIQDTRDPVGIHTHGDGIIHVHPFVRKASGAGATLEVFLDTVGGRAGNGTLSVPGYGLWHDGLDRCGASPAQVRLLEYAPDGHLLHEYKDAADVRLRDGEAITIAFDDPAARIPAPPSLDALSRLNPQTEQIEPPAK